MSTLTFESWESFLSTRKPVICGILNTTPDSFSDGGMYIEATGIEKHIYALINQGATMIDVGAESTRPGSLEVPIKEELRRLEPFFQVLDKCEFNNVLFSIDTRHSYTAEIALKKGVHAINDVSGGTFDEKMANLIANSNALYIAMHSRSTPDKMQEFTHYENVVEDVAQELQDKVNKLKSSGVKDSRIMVDPGIGFSKSPQQNLDLIENISELKNRFDYPMMVGVSRKSVIGHIITQKGLIDNMELRDQITAEICKKLVSCRVEVVRVHNVLKAYEHLNA